MILYIGRGNARSPHRSEFRTKFPEYHISVDLYQPSLRILPGVMKMRNFSWVRFIPICTALKVLEIEA